MNKIEAIAKFSGEVAKREEDRWRVTRLEVEGKGGVQKKDTVKHSGDVGSSLN